MDAYQRIMTFLAYRISTLTQKAYDSKSLKAKLTEQKEIIELESCRRTLRLQFYEYEDYMKTI